ncbi:leukotriene B4 receptor 1-like [Aplochiton taeniatus]
MDYNASAPPNRSLPSFPSSPPPLSDAALNTSSSVAVGDTVGALILSLAFLLGVPGNLFIIWSILARSRKQSVTTLLILNLALADGSLMALTPFFVVYLVRRAWVFGNVMCKVLFYLCLANMYASIQLITLMSLHRLVAILWPARLSTVASRGRVLRALVALWLLVMAASVPALLFRAQREVPGEEHRVVCESFHKQQSHVVLQYTMELVLGFVIPYTVIVGSYICILRRIRQTRFQRRVRSEKLILAIVATFCVFWMPYHIINMVQVAAALHPEKSDMRHRLDGICKSYRPITSALAFISSCANPVLYTFAGKSYIRRDGLAFMARLFEGTALDYATRKSLQNSREKDKDADGVMLKDRDPESTTSANGCLTVKPPKSNT